MEKEISDFIKLIDKGECPDGIEVDATIKRLIAYIKDKGDKCPQCHKHPIVLGFLKYEKILICKHCENERRFGSNLSMKKTVDQIRISQLGLKPEIMNSGDEKTEVGINQTETPQLGINKAALGAYK